MCDDEQGEEMQRRNQAVDVLIEHLELMGAKSCSIPVETENGCYYVKVVKTL